MRQHLRIVSWELECRGRSRFRLYTAEQRGANPLKLPRPGEVVSLSCRTTV